MATIWKGAINFGLINVPVKLLAATDKETVAFRMLHKKCGTPINQKRFCPSCGEEVEYKDISKGFEYEKGEFVEITEDDLKKIPVKSAKYIQIIDFIDISSVDPVYYEKSYYLAPETAGEKPYLILYNAMKQTNCAAISKISIRDKERLCCVRVFNDGLMLNTMFFPSEIRTYSDVGAEKIAAKTKVSQAETDLAVQIVQNLTAEFEPEKYHDEYYGQLMEMIEAKAEGKNPAAVKTEKIETKNSLDLFEKLKASVEATMRVSGSENGGKKIKEKPVAVKNAKKASAPKSEKETSAKSSAASKTEKAASVKLSAAQKEKNKTVAAKKDNRPPSPPPQKSGARYYTGV